MSAISILHAPRDEALSEKIAAALARAGHAATRVSADPLAGDLASEPVGDDGAAIVVWTHAAEKLVRLHEQAREAMERGALIPVAIGGARPPGGFESLPPVDLSGWSGAMDDPRWRFVLDEIEITRQRTRLEDGAVWPDEAPIAETAEEAVADDAPVASPPAPAWLTRTTSTEISADAPAEFKQQTADTLYADKRTAPQRQRSVRRKRFKSRDVAIGATVGIAAMALATALLAPVVLPGLSRPQTQPLQSPRTADDVPDPSVDEPSQLSTLQPLERVSPPVTTGAMEDAGAGLAPDETAPIAIALRDEEGVSGDAGAYEDANLQPAEDAPQPAASGASLDAEAVESDLPDGGAPDAASPDREAPDSDAMQNLVASIAAEEAGESLPAAQTDPLPPELRETAYLGNYFKECVACPDMAALPGGSFRMGAPLDESGSHPSEGPARMVTIDHRFAIGTREVTFDQWDACVADGGCRAYEPPDHGWGRGKRPVIGVSHEDAQAYTAWLSDKTGRNYRLPTEAEWEFAARAGAASPFAFGERITSARANFNGNYPYLNEKSAFRGRTTPAASFQPNKFGLFDMHGNAWEWTSDCWSANHEGAPSGGAARVAGDCSRRVLKGGAWNTGAWRLRSAHRIGKPANAREYDIGFRVARDLD